MADADLLLGGGEHGVGEDGAGADGLDYAGAVPFYLAVEEGFEALAAGEAVAANQSVEAGDELWPVFVQVCGEDEDQTSVEGAVFGDTRLDRDGVERDAGLFALVANLLDDRERG